ncbi:MAG: glycosyltransferase [Fimbriimonadales bacterium]|nr:glycosyltransferase [Fimbriimonadales bacterium]
MPTVSVVMAAYNAAPYIAQAIESVQAQTLDDWELIVVDDASTDETVELVRRYEGDPRVRLLRNTQNLGPAGGRNRALEAAQGKWIAVLDADDWFEPCRLERLLQTARELEVAVVYDLYRQVDARTGETLKVFFSAHAPTPTQPARYSPLETVRAHLALQPLIERALVERAGLRYREDITLGEDYLFQTLATIEAGGCGVLPEPLYNYRWHRGSTYRRNFFDLSQPIRVYETLFSDPKVRENRELQAALRDDYRRIMLARAYPQFAEAVKRRDWRKAREIYRVAPCVLTRLLRNLPAALLRRLRGESTTYDWEDLR